MISRLAEARDKLSKAFSRERQKIEKATCCLRLSKDRLIKLINDAEALYKTALDTLIDDADKWTSKLNERVGRKGTRYLVAEWKGIRIEVRPYSGVETVHIVATRRFAERINAQYPSARVGIEPIEPIAVDARRRWAIGWHASDADVDDKNRPRMETTDIGQILSWSLAWPGRFRVIAKRLVVGREVKPLWLAYSLSHRATELIPEAVGPANGDKVKSPKYRLVKLLNDPLALLAYTLGDGSPRAGVVYELRWAIAPSHVNGLIEVIKRMLAAIGVDCIIKQNTRRRYVYVHGECASALAKTMLNALESDLPIGKRLLDAIYSNEPNSKYSRLIALANWKPRVDMPLLRLDAPRVEVCGYVFAVHFDESNGLHAYLEAGGDADKVAEHVKQCLGTVSGVRIVHKGKRTRVRLGTTALELTLRRLAKEDPVKAEQVIKAIIDYLLKRAEEYKARGRTKAAQKARSKAKQLTTFLHNINHSTNINIKHNKKRNGAVPCRAKRASFR